MIELYLVAAGAVLVAVGQPYGWLLIGAACGSFIWEAVR